VLATSTLLATGSADNTIRLWNVQDGTCLHTWEFPTAVKRVEFSEDGSMLLAVTEQRMGHVGTVVVYPINEDGPRILPFVDKVDALVEVDNHISEIPTQESKATVAGWSFLDKFIIMGHENGMISQWNWKVFRLFIL
jgi:translation initiation factor 3 subunit I